MGKNDFFSDFQVFLLEKDSYFCGYILSALVSCGKNQVALVISAVCQLNGFLKKSAIYAKARHFRKALCRVFS